MKHATILLLVIYLTSCSEDTIRYLPHQYDTAQVMTDQDRRTVEDFTDINGFIQVENWDVGPLDKIEIAVLPGSEATVFEVMDVMSGSFAVKAAPDQYAKFSYTIYSTND